MTFYSERASDATELLTEFNQGEITLIQVTQSGPPHNPTSVETSHPIVGAARGVSAYNLQDSLVQSSDLIVVTDNATTPTLKDIVSIDGRKHSIIKITPKPAAGTVVAWELVIRR